MDRKARIREYKETSRPIGIYRVRNKVNGKALVGSSVNVPAILNRVAAELKLGRHRNTALQSDWNALGPDAFEFETVDLIEPPKDRPGYDPTDDLRVLEEMWLDKLDPFGENGYNGTRKQK